ncbi:hypothetical protein B0E48_10435 [Rhodanobacter sp. C03]|nr:hypothetical protein B0E48_10435 [Rhodanobacter sp. C03]
MPAVAMAQSAFDGTWKTDISKVHTDRKPVVVTLKDGMYHCTCSVPPFTVKADGTDQAVSGHPGFDTVAIKVIDDHTIQETEKKDGKVVGSYTVTVAADDKTATNEFTDSSGTTPVTGKVVLARVTKGAAGANAVNGSWQLKNYDNLSDNGLTFTYKVDGDSVSMSDPTGRSYTAKTDGAYVPLQGEPGATSVSVKKLGKDSLQETYKRDGKVMSVDTMTVSADGKTMKTVNHNKLTGATSTEVADRQ